MRICNIKFSPYLKLSSLLIYLLPHNILIYMYLVRAKKAQRNKKKPDVCRGSGGAGRGGGGKG